MKPRFQQRTPEVIFYVKIVCRNIHTGTQWHHVVDRRHAERDARDIEARCRGVRCTVEPLRSLSESASALATPPRSELAIR